MKPADGHNRRTAPGASASQPASDGYGLLAGPAGDRLTARGLITPDQREAALDMLRRRDADPVEVLLGLGPGGDRATIADTIADSLGLARIDAARMPPDPGVGRFEDLAQYCHRLMMPWHRAPDGATLFACVAPGPEALAIARSLAGGPVTLAVVTRPELMSALAARFTDALSEDARHSLLSRMPALSAGHRAPVWQRLLPAGLLLAFAAGVALAPAATLGLASGAVAAFYLANLVLRLVLVFASLPTESHAPPPPLGDDALPSYTVLVPLYGEPEVLPLLADALGRLDYPAALLDVKLILEADDGPTRAAAAALDLDGRFDIVVVPASTPRTKPKACNYALPLSRGECIVIYDAEDRPEADQLRKAAAALAHGPAALACVQARLNFDNAQENWLTRMFALDYALWFDFLLPGLGRLGMPVPLGGTSNHFRRDALEAVGAWDPFNVTEDADLGLRLHAAGYRVGVIDSTTFEEATCTPMNWLRQRSRWMKGYMQTFAVQMRDPVGLWRRVGPIGFLGITAFVGGTAASSLLGPVVWALFLVWAAAPNAGWLDLMFPPVVLAMSVVSWGLGNFSLLYLAMIAPFRRRWFGLSPWALTAGFYWGLVSVAAYRALWQWWRRPFHWEKTHHGVSRYFGAALARRRQAP